MICDMKNTQKRSVETMGLTHTCPNEMASYTCRITVYSVSYPLESVKYQLQSKSCHKSKEWVAVLTCRLLLYVMKSTLLHTYTGYTVCALTLYAEFLIYDDGCHLKKYAAHPGRAHKTPTAQRIASLHTVVNRFHFSGHVDPWCRQNCNPDKFDALKKVSTTAACTITFVYSSLRIKIFHDCYF